MCCLGALRSSGSSTSIYSDTLESLSQLKLPAVAMATVDRAECAPQKTKPAFNTVDDVTETTRLFSPDDFEKSVLAPPPGFFDVRPQEVCNSPPTLQSSESPSSLIPNVVITQSNSPSPLSSDDVEVFNTMANAAQRLPKVQPPPDSNPKHPRQKYNLDSIKNIVGGWLSSTADKTDQTLTNECDKTDQSLSNDKTNQVLTSESDNIDQLLTSKYLLTSTVTASHYGRDSEFPTLQEARHLASSSSIVHSHPAFKVETTREERKTKSKSSPKPTNQFGNLAPMCSFCGSRGKHLSHDCPQKDKNMFL